MKIILAALNAKYVHSNLAVYDLQAYAKAYAFLECKAENAIEIEVREYTINHNLDDILQSIYREHADVIAFSCYIWNISEVLQLAFDLKKVSPDTDIWLGGPEVSYDSIRLLKEKSFIKGIMYGEGEETFKELVIWCSQGKQEKTFHNIHGIVYRNEFGDVVKTPSGQPVSMDSIPFIYSDLEKFQNKIIYYESQRGCPFSCSYCLSSIDRGVRFRSMNLVKKELQFFLAHKVPQVKFIDRTFNCNKAHAMEVWTYIAEHDNGITNFHFEISADLLDEEELMLLERMRPGLVQLEIGLQSTNPGTIKEIRRKMDIGRLKSNMLRIEKAGNIHQHLDLIAGLPFEDFTSFQKSFNEAFSMKPDQLQLGFLKVLKGSYLWEAADRYNIRYKAHAPYEVMSTDWITYDQILILKQVEEMVEVYYNSAQFVYSLQYILRFFSSPFAFFEQLGAFYEKNGLFDIGFKREARYEVLMRFCQELDMDTGLFMSLLAFDYYLRENARNRPAFLENATLSKNAYNNFFRNYGNSQINLLDKGVDSKTLARKMHLEVLDAGVLKYIEAERLVTAENHVEAVSCVEDNPRVIAASSIKDEEWAAENFAGDVVYCLFDYDRRNPLSGNAAVTLFSSLS